MTVLPDGPSQASPTCFDEVSPQGLAHRAHRPQRRRRRKSNAERLPLMHCARLLVPTEGFALMDGDAGSWADMNEVGKSANICNARVHTLSECPPSRKLRMPNESSIRHTSSSSSSSSSSSPSLSPTNTWPVCLTLPWTRYFLSSGYHGEQTTDRRCHVIASTDGTSSREPHLRCARGDTSSDGHRRNPSSHPCESRPAPTHLSTLPPAHSRFAIAFCCPTPFKIPGLWCARVRSGTIHHHLFHPPQLRIILFPRVGFSVPWVIRNRRPDTRIPSSPSPSTHSRRSRTNALPRRHPPHSRRPRPNPRRHPNSRSASCARRPSRLSTRLPREVLSSSTLVVLPPIERRIRPSLGTRLVNADRDRSGRARRPATVHRLRIHRPSLSPGVSL
ncbi:hypothetical protein C8F01DRAFT_753545 [Mycena amicta]|nr:hypothetical protein C8F01DRAFT_753545 [Mycena amicta]